MGIKQKPYSLLLIAAIPLLIAGLVGANTPVDIHIHATYFIFPLASFFSISSIILAILWLLYVLTKKWLFSEKLSWIHIVSSIVTALLIIALPVVATYCYAGSESIKTYSHLTENVFTAFMLLITGQLIYFTNLCMGLSKRWQTNRH
jgi:hypothetical protein